LGVDGLIAVVAPEAEAAGDGALDDAVGGVEDLPGVLVAGAQTERVEVVVEGVHPDRPAVDDGRLPVVADVHDLLLAGLGAGGQPGAQSGAASL